MTMTSTFASLSFESASYAPSPRRRDEVWTTERCFIRELYNTPSDPEGSLAEARVPPGVTTVLHRLVDVHERYVIREGRGRMEVDGVTRDVKAGDSVDIPAGARQRIRNTGPLDLVFLCFCTPRFVPECYRDLEND
ncbi:cupin domain-containing protein [Rhodovulum sp. DZ06]|uniref:cupin domain-containing protein n=1 Tax=Rhodovulum sp. DZ06 TaxID=3425126 RepID=UPI003D351731